MLNAATAAPPSGDRITELLLFGGACQGCDGRGASSDYLRDSVEVSRADESLMLHAAIAVTLPRKFQFLQTRVCRHSRLFIIQRQIKHAKVESVETGESDELEFVTHLRQLLLEARNRFRAQFLPPVERRRAVVSQRLGRMLGVYRLSEFARFIQIRLRSLTPEQIGVRRVRQRPRNRLIQSTAHAEEPFHRPLAGDERMIALVNIAGQQ